MRICCRRDRRKGSHRAPARTPDRRTIATSARARCAFTRASRQRNERRADNSPDAGGSAWLGVRGLAAARAADRRARPTPIGVQAWAASAASTTATASCRSGTSPGSRVRWSSIRCTSSTPTSSIPITDTLAYSENNLGAGALAVPVYWADAQSARRAQLRGAAGVRPQRDRDVLPRALSDRRSRARRRSPRSRFAFCPYVFAHTAHIQLADDCRGCRSACWRSTAWPTGRAPARGAALGAAMAAQAICCGYYGVFVVPDGRIRRLSWRRRDAAVADRGVLDGDSRRPRSSQSLLVTAGVPAASRCSASGIPPRAEGRDSVFGQLERLPGELRRTRTPGCSATCRRGRRCTFPGFVAGWCFGVLVRRDRRAAIAAASCLTLYGGLTLLAFWRRSGRQDCLYSRVLTRRADVRLAARAGAFRADRRLRAVGAGRCGGCVRWLRRVATIRPWLTAALVVVAAGGARRADRACREVPPVEPVYRTLALRCRAGP